MIKVFDNLLSLEEANNLEESVSKLNWRSHWHSSGERRKTEGRKEWHWHYSFFQDTRNMPSVDEETLQQMNIEYPYIINLWNRTQQAIMNSTGLKCDFARAYANAHTYGVEGLIHKDDGDFTALFYPFSEWNIEWEGGTCFYNKEKTDVLAYCPYVHNRLVVFNANTPHRAMPVTRDCYRLRAVVVFKCVIDVNHPSYAKYYKENLDN